MHQDIPVPNLTTAHSGPLYHIEKLILNEVARIESWFREKWQETPAPITTSVDLRHAGFKLAPVDTNLFPAGFNNLNPDFLPLCVQAAQSILVNYLPTCKNILLLPESHTRNQFYLQSLAVLRAILDKAGFMVRLGNLDETMRDTLEMKTLNGESLLFEPLIRQGDYLSVAGFKPCLILLNNDLSTGIPPILQGIKQAVHPSAQLGWSVRRKSTHFQFYNEVVREFSELIQLDPWLINPYFKTVNGIDFMAQEGIEELADKVEHLLTSTQKKYDEYGIDDQAFAVIKADNGTYGMSVMMVNNARDVLQLNRKQRTRMAASKGSQKVENVIVQEGVYSFETMPDGAVAEPVVYMMGQFVVGGFYRVHQGRGNDENLNAPGMHFEPLAFAQACNIPRRDLQPTECPNRFYAYGVIARLAALAAAKERAALEVNT